MSEGLILLTNNGELARHLEHPSSGYRRRYELELHGEVPFFFFQLWKLTINVG